MTAGPQSVPAGAYYLLHRAVALTNSSGYVVEASDTNVYGNTLIFTAPDSTGNWWSDSANQDYCYGASEINYCGYRFDPETQLYYVRNRTYSPVLGRWLQRDPIGYEGGVNFYEYVAARALAALDALGAKTFHTKRPNRLLAVKIVAHFGILPSAVHILAKPAATIHQKLIRFREW